MAKGNFGTVINCMDGRTQLPVNEYLRREYGLDFIDTVNEQADVLQSIDPEMLQLFRNYAEEIDLFEEFATKEDKRIYGYIGTDEVKSKSHKLIENVKDRAKTLGITIEV